MALTDSVVGSASRGDYFELSPQTFLPPFQKRDNIEDQRRSNPSVHSICSYIEGYGKCNIRTNIREVYRKFVAIANISNIYSQWRAVR
jgi:hypothetical protein